MPLAKEGSVQPYYQKGKIINHRKKYKNLKSIYKTAEKLANFGDINAPVAASGAGPPAIARGPGLTKPDN